MRLRYGAGIYSSSTSSKANDYVPDDEYSTHEQTGSSHGKKKLRMMFLCKVAAGKSYVTQETQMEPQQVQDVLAQGHNSIIGEPSKGGLNYDEIVVYDSQAIIPSYVIVYMA